MNEDLSRYGMEVVEVYITPPKGDMMSKINEDNIMDIIMSMLPLCKTS